MTGGCAECWLQTGAQNSKIQEVGAEPGSGNSAESFDFRKILLGSGDRRLGILPSRFFGLQPIHWFSPACGASASCTLILSTERAGCLDSSCSFTLQLCSATRASSQVEGVHECGSEIQCDKSTLWSRVKMGCILLHASFTSTETRRKVLGI